MYQRNSCNDIRLFAAILVVFSHSFMLASGSNDHEPMFWLSHGQVTTGGLSVFTFFVLSGFLITGSFERSQNITAFAAARAVRIIPALAVVLFVTAFMLGPCLTRLSAAAYWKSAEPFTYIIRNLSLLTYADSLPGVLPDNPFPGIVNGSLWTLHIEAACYALVVFLGITRQFNPFLSAGLFVMGLAFTIASTTIDYPVLLITCFLAGAGLHHWPMRRSRRGAVACAGVLVASAFAGGFVVAFATAGAYVVWYLAFSPPWRENGITGSSDLSYGTYIWAFPVQQMVVQFLGEGVTWYAQVMISLPIILALAWLSWNMVEKHALRWKSRRQVQLPIML